MQQNDNMGVVVNSLKLYVERGVLPGSQLQAVLENDLTWAFSRADSWRSSHMLEIVSYCWKNIPSACWGSPEKVEAWVKEARRKFIEE